MDYVVKATTIAGAVSLDNQDHTPWVFSGGSWYCRVRTEQLPEGLKVIAEGNEPHEIGSTTITDQDGNQITHPIQVGIFA